MNRRRFLTCSSQLISAGAVASAFSSAAFAQDNSRPPPLAPDLVRNVVGLSHRDLAGVSALVDAHPSLANACWDWGGGDFETPLQAAAHTGQREIATYLLSRGARIDVFAAAMLGQLDFVKATFATNPALDRIPGPHGFTLHHCAQTGGDAAAAVVEFLVAHQFSTETKRPLPS